MKNTIRTWKNDTPDTRQEFSMKPVFSLLISADHLLCKASIEAIIAQFGQELKRQFPDTKTAITYTRHRLG